MEGKTKVDCQLVHLNYKEWEGWGKHLEIIRKHLEFAKDSPYKLVLANPYNYPKKPGDKIIWVSTFEADRLPNEFIGPANEGIAVIVPAEWVKKVFINSGVTVPIYVCPEGITDRTVWHPSTDPFMFLHLDSTSAYNRKGTDLVLQAFINVFGNMQDKVELVMKGRDHQQTWTHPHLGNVVWIYENYSPKQMEVLWSNTNCFVFPSRGEGFGLPPLEAMGHGIPTILTNGSAMQSFARLGIPIRVAHKTQALYDKLSEYGEWEEPDLLELQKMMEFVYYNYVDEKAEAEMHAEIIWNNYNSRTVAMQLADTIGLIMQREDVR